jgi:hypothetical protein
MRDDRIGGASMTNSHFASLKDDPVLWNATLAVHAAARDLWANITRLFEAEVAGKVTDFNTREWIRTSVEYGLRLHTVVEAGWRVMAFGYRKSHNMTYSPGLLAQAILDYDNAWEVPSKRSNATCPSPFFPPCPPPLTQSHFLAGTTRPTAPLAWPTHCLLPSTTTTTSAWETRATALLRCPTTQTQVTAMDGRLPRGLPPSSTHEPCVLGIGDTVNQYRTNTTDLARPTHPRTWRQRQ